MDSDVICGLSAASAVAGIPVSTLKRRMLAGLLQGEKGDDGVYRFDRVDLEAMRFEQDTTRTPRTAEDDEAPLRRSQPSTEGALAAAAFALFEEGVGCCQAVIRLRQPPAVIEALHKEYLALRGIRTVSWLTWSGIEAALGRELAAENLSTEVARLARVAKDYARLAYPCAECGEPVQLTAEDWTDLVRAGLVESLCHEQCAGE